MPRAYLDHQTFIMEKADMLGFKNIKGDPVHEKALVAACQDKASSACTQFHKAVSLPCRIALACVLANGAVDRLW